MRPPRATTGARRAYAAFGGEMKGFVFNLLADLVRRDFGDDTWDDLLDAAKASGAYTSLGSYEDEELHRLVAAASDALGRSPADVLRWYGRGAMPMLAQATCMHRGDDRCVFELAFAPAGASARTPVGAGAGALAGVAA